jgi:hypothetical protein
MDNLLPKERFTKVISYSPVEGTPGKKEEERLRQSKSFTKL